MNDKITQALTTLFQKERIVFWYDTRHELEAAFSALDLPHVEKIRLNNNPFMVKHRLLREQPEQKFLVYQAGEPPADADNWLLDVMLANKLFSADQRMLWLSELGLGPEFGPLVTAHEPFFHDVARLNSLKTRLDPHDSQTDIRLKMTAICCQAEDGLDRILEQLLQEQAEAQTERQTLLESCHLTDFLWQQVAQTYGYQSDNPTVKAWALALFEAGYDKAVSDETQLKREAYLFLNRWQTHPNNRQAFSALSELATEVLDIEHKLAYRTLEELVSLDLFELVDQRLLSDLIHQVTQKTIPTDTCLSLIRQRERTHWYAKYADIYQAVACAAQLLGFLAQADLTMRDVASAVYRYTQTWYQLDQWYRRFIFHQQRAGQQTLLGALADEVERRYSNQFLLPLNDSWQQLVDGQTAWRTGKVRSQADFFEEEVKRPFIDRNGKVAVIISDGLRYEAGEALWKRVRQQDRYEATLHPALTLLPSFTALGMAALLPHETLALEATGRGVQVDGQSSAGTANRAGILARVGGTAVQAHNLLKMKQDESRVLMRDYTVLYVYHNRIDSVGDKRDTEERTAEAVEDSLDELLAIIKKLANANFNNMLITADHGFLYQHQALDESDFLSQQPEGEIVARNRRFVLGQNLVNHDSFHHWTASQVGLQDNGVEMLIPKSINRLRLQGAGSRYVHGGAAMQEMIIPILHINKKRKDDVSQVNVDILRGSSDVITTGQLTVAFYQTEAVTAKRQPRTLKAGLYLADEANTPISDEQTLLFNFPSDNPRDRELSVQFILTQQAEQANGQDVYLRLLEPESGTSRYKRYKEMRYLLRRSFTSDFDF